MLACAPFAPSSSTKRTSEPSRRRRLRGLLQLIASYSGKSPMTRWNRMPRAQRTARASTKSLRPSPTRFTHQPRACLALPRHRFGASTPENVKLLRIGVEKAFRPPLPPNRTCGFPAYGSPVGSFFIETVSPTARPCEARTARLPRRRHLASVDYRRGRVPCPTTASPVCGEGRAAVGG